MKRVFAKKSIIIFVAAFVVIYVGCKRKDVFIPESPIFSKKEFASDATKKVVNRSNLIKKVVADTLKEIASGVKLTTIDYLDYSDKAMRLFITEIDLKNPNIKLKAGTPNNASAFNKQLVSDIARTQDAVGNRVLLAINGDFFNASTGEPQSILYKNGAPIKRMYNLCTLCSYLAINDQGVAMIGTKDRPVDSTKIREAVGGYHLLVKDSLKVTQGDLSIDPRTGVGVTKDNVVYLMVVDGRQATYSNGMSFSQMSDLFLALGVRDAINQDGGGSTTLVVKEGTTWNVINHPSDGVARPVANAWTVVSTQ